MPRREGDADWRRGGAAVLPRLEMLMAWVRRSGLNRRPALWQQVVLIAGVLWIYDKINAQAPTRIGAANAHGGQVLAFERQLHIAWESPINHWVASHVLVADAMDYFYLFMQFAVVAALLLWAYVRYPKNYRSLRDALFLTNLIAFAVFWTFPTTPPRLLPAHHFADTIARFGTLWSWDSGITAKTANLYAAMPSLHAAYAVWVALFLGAVGASVWARALGWAYVVATTAVIMGTGNHYLVDALAGALTAVLAYNVSNVRHAVRLLRVTAVMSIDPPVALTEDELPVEQVS